MSSGCREIRTLVNYLWKCKILKSLWKQYGSFYKIKNTISLLSSIPLLGIQ